MEFTFVLKDKGTFNQGWWLKISNAEELMEYYKNTSARNEKIIEDWMENHSRNHLTNSKTYAVKMYGERLNEQLGLSLNFVQALDSFNQMVAQSQLEKIFKYGCIFINSVGGYHADYDGEHKYDFIRRKKLIFPDFKKEEIRIKQFPNGEHFYAYIDDIQVRNGDTLKWNTYEEAYNKAIEYIDKGEQKNEI